MSPFHTRGTRAELTAPAPHFIPRIQSQQPVFLLSPLCRMSHLSEHWVRQASCKTKGVQCCNLRLWQHTGADTHHWSNLNLVTSSFLATIAASMLPYNNFQYAPGAIGWKLSESEVLYSGKSIFQY